MNIESFLSKYKESMKRLAHQKECNFYISIFETPFNYYIGIYNKDNTNFYCKSSNLNDCINQLKIKYPELNSEEGVK